MMAMEIAFRVRRPAVAAQVAGAFWIYKVSVADALPIFESGLQSRGALSAFGRFKT